MKKLTDLIIFLFIIMLVMTGTTIYFWYESVVVYAQAEQARREAHDRLELVRQLAKQDTLEFYFQDTNHHWIRATYREEK